MPDEAIEPLLPYASHFHVRGARPGRLQVAFKDNVIDYRRMVDLLAKRDYKGWLGVEYVWIDWEQCNECDNLSETILFRDFLRSLATVMASKPRAEDCSDFKGLHHENANVSVVAIGSMLLLGPPGSRSAPRSRASGEAQRRRTGSSS